MCHETAFRPSDNVLLGAAYRSGGPGYLLVQIDTGTGAVEDVGPSIVRPQALRSLRLLRRRWEM